MTAINGDTNGAASGPSWSEFCEQHAATAAEEFAKAFRSFIVDHPHLDRPSACQDFANKFVEFFLEHFEAQTLLKHLTNRTISSPTKSPKRVLHRTPALGHHRSHTFDGVDLVNVNREGGPDLFMTVRDIDINGHHATNHLPNSSPKHSKSLLRRLSFRGFQGIRNTVNKPFRQLFKQHSDDGDFSSSSHFNSPNSMNRISRLINKNDKPEKTKLTKMFVECLREGVVNQLIGEDSQGRTRWEKCRLVLMKATGGHMLEFYTPPKVTFIDASVLNSSMFLAVVNSISVGRRFCVQSSTQSYWYLFLRFHFCRFDKTYIKQ